MKVHELIDWPENTDREVEVFVEVGGDGAIHVEPVESIREDMRQYSEGYRPVIFISSED